MKRGLRQSVEEEICRTILADANEQLERVAHLLASATGTKSKQRHQVVGKIAAARQELTGAMEALLP